MMLPRGALTDSGRGSCSILSLTREFIVVVLHVGIVQIVTTHWMSFQLIYDLVFRLVFTVFCVVLTPHLMYLYYISSFLLTCPYPYSAPFIAFLIHSFACTPLSPQSNRPRPPNRCRLRQHGPKSLRRLAHCQRNPMPPSPPPRLPNFGKEEMATPPLRRTAS